MEEEIVIKCGKNHYSFEKLEQLCKKEAEKLIPTIARAFNGVPEDFDLKNEKVPIACWTDELWSELIGEVWFKKNENGEIVYEFDNSMSTL